MQVKGALNEKCVQDLKIGGKEQTKILFLKEVKHVFQNWQTLVPAV